MFVKKVHSVVAILFLAVFFSAQFAGYHSLSHDADSAEHCKVCDEAIQFGQTPFVLGEHSEYEELNAIPVLPTAVISTYEIPLESSEFHAKLYSRPPPVNIQA